MQFVAAKTENHAAVEINVVPDASEFEKVSDLAAKQLAVPKDETVRHREEESQ